MKADCCASAAAGLFSFVVEPVEGEGEAIAAAIGITRTADTTSYSTFGALITYPIVVTNTGNCVLTFVEVEVLLTGLDAGIASLAPGAYETFTEEYAVTQADLDAGEALNAVTAAGRDPEGPDAGIQCRARCAR